jgi:hypothetical protein
VVYDPRGAGREVIRAGYSIVYDQPAMFHHIRSASVPPWGSLITLNNVALSDPFATYPGGNPFPLAVDKNATFPLAGTYWLQPVKSDPPRTQHFNVSFQQQYGENWSVTAELLRQPHCASLERHRDQSRRSTPPTRPTGI